MSTAERRGPGRPAGGRRVVDREAVLDNAEVVIRRDGAGVSLEAIARESGVTKPIVYARVGGRTELANALSQRLIERLIASTTAAIAASDPGRPALAAFIEATLETTAQHRELFLYVTAGAPDDSAARRLYLATQAAVPIAEQLATWRAENDRDPAVALPWAYSMIGMLNLVSLWWLEEPDRSATVLADQLADLLWSGLAH